MEDKNNPLLCVIGPTATGKTRLAVALADFYHAEILSADSRQVYRQMDIGTGKDKEEYIVEGRSIPFHLIDIVEAGYHYNIFEYQRDFYKAYATIRQRNRNAILCGGSGMYIDSVLRNYRLDKVPENKELRLQLESVSMETLIEKLSQLTSLHNHTDTCDRDRLIRAIEIQEFYKKHPELKDKKKFDTLIFYVHVEREILRERITQRLVERLHHGMIEEVEAILHKGLSPEAMMYYGLEYKYITLYITGELSYNEMQDQLNTAIHQFAKRQCTWFRGMQRKGMKFHIIDGSLSNKEKLATLTPIVEAWGGFSV